MERSGSEKSPPVEPGSALNVRAGVIELSDLQGYEARVRPALSTTYRDYTLYGLGLPSSGGIAVAEALNLLEAYDTATLTPVEVLHRTLGASRLAFADRGAFLGDPEFVDAPVQGLLSKDYADARRAHRPALQRRWDCDRGRRAGPASRRERDGRAGAVSAAPARPRDPDPTAAPSVSMGQQSVSNRDASAATASLPASERQR